MVLSLRGESTEPDSTMAAWNKFLERFSESMTKFADQFVEDMKQARLKSDPKHDRKVLICGYTQDEDCLCVKSNAVGSDYDEKDEHGVALVCEEEEKSSVEDPIEQSFKNSKEQIVEMDKRQVFDEMTEREGDYEEDDHEEFQAKIDDPSPPVHQGHNESVHDMVPRQADNSMVRKFCANKKGIHIANKVFDKIPDRRRYIASLNPDPPDDYDQRTTGGTIEQLDPTHLWLQRVESLKSGNAHEIRMTHNEFDEMLRREALAWNVMICHNLYENCLCVVMNNISKPMYNDSGGKTRDMHTTDLSADDVGRKLPIAEISNVYKHLASTDDIVDLVAELESYVVQVEQIHLEDKVKFEEGNVWIILDWCKDKSLLEAKVTHDIINHYWIWGNASKSNLYEPSVNGKTFDESLEQEWDSWDDVMINIKASRYFSNVYLIDTDFEEFSLEGILNSVTHSSLHVTTESSNIAKVKYNQAIGGKAAACKSLGYSFDSGGIFVLARDERCKKILNSHIEGKTDFKRKTKNEEVYSQTWKISLVSQIQQKGKDLKQWKSVRRGWNVFLYKANRVVLLQAALAIMEFYFPAFVKTKGAEVQNLDHWDYYITGGMRSALEQNQSQLVCEDGEDDSSYMNIILVENVSFDFSTIVPMQVPNVCLAPGIQIIEEFHSLMMSPFFYTGTIMISTRTTNINDLVNMYGSTKNVWVTRDDVTVQRIKITHGNGKGSTYCEITKREPNMKRNDNIWTSELKESGLYWGVIFDPGGIILLPIAEECRSTLKCHLEDKVVANRWGNGTKLIETKLVVVMEKNNLLGAIVTLCGSAENELNISNYMNSTYNLTDAISRSFCAQSLTNVQSAAAKNTKKQRVITGGGALAAGKKAIVPKVVHHEKVMVKPKPEVLIVISPNNEEVKKVEDENLIFDYMDSQPETNEKGRAILVDWLIEFHNKFEFVSKILYLTINTVDHYLNKDRAKEGIAVNGH